MLDATMLLLSNLEYPFLTFIAIDPRVIVKAIEDSYGEMLLNSGVTGFEYLDKLIQIPFNIPTASPKTKDNIVCILTREKEHVLNMVIKLCLYLNYVNILNMIVDVNINNLHLKKPRNMEMHVYQLYFGKNIKNMSENIKKNDI